MKPMPELVAQDGHTLAADHPESPLAIAGMTVSYGDKPVLFSVDFVTPPGAMLAVIGPNGAGKSTLIKAALGIVPRVSGKVTVFGAPWGDARHRIAYVPQRASVDWDFPATVLDVVRMGQYREIGFLRFAGAGHRKRAMDCLERVGMQGFAHRQIGQLSGGQQQRVFLARALAQQAALYVMDEPFAGVDAATERAIIAALKDLNAQGKTIICVHHDLATVQDYFGHVLILNIRKIADGPVSATFTPENLQSAYGGRLATAQIDRIAVGQGNGRVLSGAAAASGLQHRAGDGGRGDPWGQRRGYRQLRAAAQTLACVGRDQPCHPAGAGAGLHHHGGAERRRALAAGADDRRGHFGGAGAVGRGLADRPHPACCACALPGNFLVLRRLSLIGDAISHVALPGIVVAFLLTGRLAAGPMLAGAAGAAIVAVGLIELIRRLGNIEPGAAMGVVFTTLFAAGVLLLEQSDTSKVHLDVEHALYGNLESLIWLRGTSWVALTDPVALAALPPQLGRLAMVAFTELFWKELVIGTFDAGFAASIGARPGPVGFGLVVMVAVAAFDAVGSIIVIAMFICPPASARMMTDRIGPQIAWSLGFATLAAVSGYVLAGYGPLWLGGRNSVSAAGMIATVSGVVLGLAALWGPRRRGAHRLAA